MIFNEYFFEVYQGVPRGGPGSNASTRRAFSLLPTLPMKPRVLDVGCGPGMQTLELARLTDGTIMGLDNNQAFLDQLCTAAAAAGFADRIKPVSGSMDALTYGPEEFDLIWAEGSLFIIGMAAALAYLKPFLRPGGCLAATELTWLRPDMPAAISHYLTGVYPAILDVAGNLALFAAEGYQMVNHFALPADDWLVEYYKPIEARLISMEAKYRSVPEAMAVVEEFRREIDMYRRYGEYYGYVFYIAQK